LPRGLIPERFDDATKLPRKVELAIMLWDQALQFYNMYAVREIYDRIDGRPNQQIEIPEDGFNFILNFHEALKDV